MAGERQSAGVIRFGPFTLDRKAGEIRKNDLRVRLQQQPLLLLEALLERPGQVVTREELRDLLWPDGVFLDFERGLNKAVNRLREVLGDHADEPRFIETLPKRGYRFLEKVEASARPTIPSIAVLPLENLSADATQEYFSDGMTDVLIGELAKIASLRVISRTSVMGFKRAHGKRIPEIARELGVDTILEGTITTAAGHVRITAQLIDGRNDHHLWSQKYECELTAVLQVQAAIAAAIAREVNASLRPEEQRRVERAREVNADAYDAYLQGQYFLHQNIRGVVKSIECFQRSIAADTTYADAFAGLAQALIFAGIYEFRPFAEAYREASAAVERALQLDPRNAAAHNARADIRKGLEWDLEGAEREHRLAAELSPSHLLTRLWLSETLSRMERHEEALEESARALRLDPVSAISHNNRSMLLWRARRWDEAMGEAQTALELDPSHVNALWWRGLAHAGKEEFGKAVECLGAGLQASQAPVFVASLGFVHGLAGDEPKARQMLAQLEDVARARIVSATNFATIYAGLGDADGVFRALEAAYEARDGRVHQLVTPVFDRYRGDGRFETLKKRVGL